MITKQTLTDVVARQREFLLSTPLGIPREKFPEVSPRSGIASIITGIRRCGKSTLLRQLVESAPGFKYLNFEDVRLFQFEAGDFTKLEEVFGEDESVFFFDEIQNIAGWERFVRTLLNRGKKVVITGSNASMLSKELGTKLTGRHIATELFPFSYDEFCSFNEFEPSVATFDQYIERGGFPEYLRISDPNLLQTLLIDILMRDIIVRNGLRDEGLVKELALYLITNSAKEFSYNSLKNLFGAGSVNTIISILNHFEDSYLFFTIQQFDFSYKKRIVAPKKIYSIDTGMLTVNTSSFSSDRGRLLENSVFLHLKRKGNEVFYFKGKRECDFITRSGRGEFAAYQVCHDLNNDNMERETAGLVEAMNTLRLDTGFLITRDQTDKFTIDGKVIDVLPAWQWFSLLMNKSFH